MGRILYFDYCAVLILIILLITTIYRGMNHGKAQKLFIMIISVGLISTIADISAVLVEQMGPGRLAVKHITHNAYLIFHNLSIPLYMVYLVVLSDSEHRFSKKMRVLFAVPFTLVLVVTLTNPIHNQLFYFDENDAYIRGNIFWLLYISVFFYVVFGIYQLLHQKNSYGRNSLIALSSVFMTMFIAMIIQFIMPNILCEMVAHALGLLTISCMLQRPEEYIDTDAGIGKESAYVQKMSRVLANEKPCKLILISLKNYSSLQRMLGYKQMVELIKAISKRLENMKYAGEYQLENYYLRAGRFCVLLEPEATKYMEKIAEEVNALLLSDIQINGMNVQLLPLVGTLNSLSEVDDFETLAIIGNEFDKLNYTGKVLSADELIYKKNYDLIRDMDEIIERAMVNGGFEVYYQPIYSVHEKRFNSAEALLRLKDEKYGFVSPEFFISAAEKNGSIHRIGAFVMESVCSFISSEEFKNTGLDYIEVNLSVAQCMRTDLAEEVVGIMKKYGVAPTQINLEITETAASYSQKVLSDNIQTLTEHGISFSLDDYGTGYSNMRRIASMPFEIIKLDKSFAVTDCDEKMKIVIENTIRMIKAMNMKIVVEGIETEQLARQFAELECEYIQGYYYSRPVPRSTFIEFIKNSMQGNGV